MEQSSSACHRRNLGQLLQESSGYSLEDYWIWTIKAQPMEVHNITSTITSTSSTLSFGAWLSVSKWHTAPEVHGLVARPVFTINSTGLGIK